MERQWLSRHEILNDLAEVTGTLDGGRQLTSIRDRPPNKAAELDDESEQFLRMCGADGGDIGGGEGRRGESEGPDLTNIQRMLQMLYESEDMPNHNEMEDVTSHSTQKLVISKLNPNVSEFIPKKNKNYNGKSPNKEDLNKQNLNVEKTKENYEFDKVDCMEKEAQSSAISNNNEIPKMVDVIETKKLRKNVAMSSISAINANAEAVSTKILLTPDDFCLKPKTEKTIENIMADNLESFRNETHNKIVKNDNLKESEEDNDPNVEVSPLDVQESIKKVNNWLEPKVVEPPKPVTPPAPHLGPITYRRKELVSPKSESPMATLNTPDTSSKSTSSTSPLPYKPYKPSSYADELLKKFESNAAKSAAESEDIWTKLERELKAKDEVIKKASEGGEIPLHVEKTKSRGRKR